MEQITNYRGVLIKDSGSAGITETQPIETGTTMLGYNRFRSDGMQNQGQQLLALSAKAGLAASTRSVVGLR